MALTRKQLTLVHLAKAQTGITEESYRDLLASRWKVASSKDLSHPQLDELLKVFRSLGFRAKRTARPRPNALELASPAQLAFLAKCYDGLGWEPARRVGFNRKMTGRPWPQSRADCNKIIEALKAMAQRNYTDRTTPMMEDA